ncbi:MAG: NUDIX hydrolase [Rhodospirillales bacterium]|nr:NUDIX hydrolase [Rhodospirillales bacterium]
MASAKKRSRKPGLEVMAEQIAGQSGVIPYRLGPDGLQVLLITSRETHRWVIPKGNIGKGMTARDSAAREAFEEAGIQGVMQDVPLGFYTYGKVLKDGREQPTVVEVFALRIIEQAKKWPEKKERTCNWMAPIEAARAVQEPGLAILLLRLAEIHATSSVQS